jgi:hypothetical protein
MKLILFLMLAAPVREERLGMLDMGKSPDRVETFAQPQGAGTKRMINWKSEAEVEEFGYDETGIVVFEKQQDWLRIKSKQGANLWVKLPPGGKFVGLADLLQNTLTYLTKEDWDQRLSPVAGGQRGAKIKTELEPTVRVVGKQLIDGKLWVEVTIFDASPCEVPKPKVISRGWVPARMVWYYSRGC